jgi:putative selenate reductase
VAAQNGYEGLIKEMKASDRFKNKKVAVVGAGPAGISSAFFLAREGADVTVFEKRSEAGGVVKFVVPEFRIPGEDVNKDVALAEKMGAKFVYNHPITDLKELKDAGYEAIILAVGATKGMPLGIPCDGEINAIEFLEACRNAPDTLKLGKNVAIIGAGNTAMDAARAAKRADGVENSYIVYRRTEKYMPADEEELEMALEDGVEFKELLAPVAHRDGKLVCHKVILGEMDASGRQIPVETDEEVILDVDTVVASLGEKVDGAYYEALGLKVNSRGNAVLDAKTMETSIEHVYVVGDGANGPATVVEAIRDASKAVNAILGLEPREVITIEGKEEKVAAKKGVLLHAEDAKEEAKRCLECNFICEACTEVCPNRANIAVKVPGITMPQIIHVDYMCNECGNCKSFCPYDSAPYKEKFTLFLTLADFENSENQGFVMLQEDKLTFRVRLGERTQDVNLKDPNCNLYDDIKKLILAVYDDYRYLLLA